MPKTRSVKSKPSYEELGQMLVTIYESGYLDKNQAYKMSFLKGLFSGLGGVVGATILVALLIWILSVFNSVPLIGHFVDKVQHTIQSERTKP